MRQTRIVATLGPASDSEEAIEQLLLAGVEIFRLNFSHGTHESHAQSVRRIRAAVERHGRLAAVLQDLSGPKIRTGRIAGGGPMPLTRGGPLRIITGDEEGGDGIVYTPYAELARSVRPGQQLLLDDGRVVLHVEGSDGREIRTTVVHGSSLGEHKGINAPGVPLPAVGLTEKDVRDLTFGLELGVDLVAVSFVQSGEDVRTARKALDGSGGAGVPIVAKLERPEAIAHLDDILQSADAVMVARGDLGLEMPLERVPGVQKEITRRARAVGRPVIVATEVLDSMRTEPRPTRAEVSDAANAVEDGVDAIMLSGETAVGRHPVRAAEMLASIIVDAEREQVPALPTAASFMHAHHGRALCEAAVTLARRGGAEAIVAVTRQGNTARMLSSLRPGVAIVAATPDARVARRLLLYRGVFPVVVEVSEQVEVTAEAIAAALRAREWLKPGDEVVFVNVHDDLARRGANFLTLNRVEG